MPVGERAEELVLRLPRQAFERHRAGQLGREPDLLDVHRAALAAVEVPLEAPPVLGGQRVVQVHGHQLDELAAAEVLDGAHATSSEAASSSRTARSFERARCRWTRWASASTSRAAATSSALQPWTSRSATRARWDGGR